MPDQRTKKQITQRHVDALADRDRLTELKQRLAKLEAAMLRSEQENQILKDALQEVADTLTTGTDAGRREAMETAYDVLAVFRDASSPALDTTKEGG